MYRTASDGGTQRKTIELTGEILFGLAEKVAAGREAHKGYPRKRGTMRRSRKRAIADRSASFEPKILPRQEVRAGYEYTRDIQRHFGKRFMP